MSLCQLLKLNDDDDDDDDDEYNYTFCDFDITIIHVTIFYIGPGGYVIPGVCLSVCQFVILATSCKKTTDRIFMKILPEMYLWTRKN